MNTANELLGHFDSEAIARTIQEVEHMKASRRDYIWPSKRLRMAEGRLVLSGKTFQVQGGDGSAVCYTTWQDAEAAADHLGGKIAVVEDSGAIPINRTTLTQIADKLGVPTKYLSSLRERGQGSLADHNVTTLLQADDRNFLLRTLADQSGSRVRAFLSDGYRVLDNADLFFCAAETFTEKQAEVWQARLWGDGDGFEVFGVASKIRGQVRLDRPFDPGDGWLSRWKGTEGDVQNAAVRISNSETGTGGLNVRFCIFTRICANFCIWGNTVSQVHLGRRREEEGLILSEDTQAMESELVWKKVRNAIRTAFDPVRFQAYIDRLDGLTQQVIPEPGVAVGNVVKAFGITEERKAAILAGILGTGDRSRYGLIQAVTGAAHLADRQGGADEASHLEEVGSQLVTMADEHFAGFLK